MNKEMRTLLEHICDNVCRYPAAVTDREELENICSQCRIEKMLIAAGLKKKMKIYISGPITGTDDYLERFERVEKALVAAGHEVINPAKINAELPMTTTYEQYMEMSFTMLDMCDCIFMMNEWKESPGALREFERAKNNRMIITFEGGM